MVSTIKLIFVNRNTSNVVFAMRHFLVCILKYFYHKLESTQRVQTSVEVDQLDHNMHLLIIFYCRLKKEKSPVSHAWLLLTACYFLNISLRS